ncbi:mannosyltransferase [Clydaea vesicula]|uniref:Mannosyltransferase n=1 Tax=Clydaea vesicula TaxID=447962 RepID=A0AAD5TZ58_9FUNG|nr:mannosyltransferase [Clydaea vesicula]
MYCTSLALSFAILPSNLQNNIKLILSIGIGSLIGWPFMGVLIVPLFLNEILNLKGFVSMFKVTGRWITMGIAVILSLSVPIVLTDAFFYKKYAFVPINIINYNVFSGNVSKGPDIFGTEPFDFYFKNLFLNFNLVFILALLSAPILTLSCITLFFQDQARLNPTIFGKYFARISIFYLWLIIFTLQPHKEERFMFVVYPMICFNASMTLYFIERHVEMFRLPRFISNVFSKVFSPTILVVFVVLSLSRSASLYYNYHSPISVYKSFYNETQNLDVEKRLCLGKEWHRFPSHFFIPDKVNVQFLKSDFNGLLPKHFENKENGWRSGTWTVPSDMNDINKEEFGRYVNVETCDFLIDLELYQLSETKNEPSYVKDTKNWEIIECQKFLNHQKTPSLNRIFYIPDFIFEDQRVWGDYCILKKKNL